MPAQQLEQQMCDWIEKPSREACVVSRKNSRVVMATPGPEKSAKDELYPGLYFEFQCEHDENYPEQDIWNLARFVRRKIVATEAFRRWTEEDLRIFAEEDKLDPERARRLEEFLRPE